MRKIFTILLILLSILACSSRNRTTPVAKNAENELYLLVGTYTSGSSTGIYVYRFDTESGVSEYASEVRVSNPSYLVISSDEQFVYAVGENDIKEAAANAFSFDKKTGTLKFLNAQLAKGAGPCYINTDRAGKFVVTANYSGGSVSVFPLGDDGALLPAEQVFGFEGPGPDRQRQERPHLHCVMFSPDQKYLFAEDLGTDKIHKFDVHDRSFFLTVGKPDAFQIEPGSGPRHLCFHSNGKYAYLLNELSGKVTVFNYADGNLEPIQYIAADTTAGEGGKGSADIHVSPDGKFLYASNRLQSDGIAIFSINETDGTLISIGYQPTGIHPRNFIITPNGKYLLVANKDSNNIQVFGINTKNGLLTDTGKQIEVDKPVCLKFINRN